MNEKIHEQNFEARENGMYGLRTATGNDVEFLFKVSTEAMKPVDVALNPNKIFDREEEFKKYQEKFIPQEIQIISYDGQDVGRLRVVRSGQLIYVGGIQILPEFQGKGIGSALFLDLLSESEEKSIPITLEVHDVNEEAFKFYTKLGFISVGREVNKTLMEYRPKSE
jgi:ribosomal protein S18 acetylase RimI-like enzyme